MTSVFASYTLRHTHRSGRKFGDEWIFYNKMFLTSIVRALNDFYSVF